MPKFTLIDRMIYRGDTRLLVRGTDLFPETCHGYDSESCQLNRSLLLECSEGACDNRRLQARAFVPTVVRPGPQGHWKLEMAADGKAGDVIGEYIGECLELEQFWQRWERIKDLTALYYCALTPNTVIDGSRFGGYLRFANHSCQPTAHLEPWGVQSYRRIAGVLTQDLDKGKEVTVSYNYPGGGMATLCWCAADNCTGWINRLGKELALPVREVPSDEEVKQAMLAVAVGVQQYETRPMVREIWATLKLQLEDAEPVVVAGAVHTPQGENVRAELVKRGPPFTRPLVVHFGGRTGAQREDDGDDGKETMAQPDVSVTFRRVAPGGAGGRVPTARSGPKRNADFNGGGKRMGGHAHRPRR